MLSNSPQWMKLRFVFLYPLGLLALFFCDLDDKSFAAGIGYVVIGVFIRLWANSYAVKMDKLTTCGPYSIVRNPLYLGTILIILGIIIILKLFWVGIILFMILLGIYVDTIKKEEKMLEEKFKERFIDYKKHVPALIPTIFPYKGKESWPFSFKRLLQSREHKIALWVFIFIFIFYLKEELLVENDGMRPKIWIFLSLAIILASLDILGAVLKRK